MTNIYRAALPLMTLLAVPLVAAEARQQTPEITVTAPSDAEVRAWTSRVGSAIDRKMRYPQPLGMKRHEEGMVDVTFKCSEDGRPTAVKVVSTSGSPRLDQAGRRAVEKVPSLHPLPAGIGPDQVYKAQLLFATEDGSDRWREQAEAMRAKANKNNAKLAARLGGQATAAVVTLMPAGTP